MSFTLDYGLGALTHQGMSVTARVKLKNVSLEWSLSCQNDSGYEARHGIPGREKNHLPQGEEPGELHLGPSLLNRHLSTCGFVNFKKFNDFSYYEQHFN